MVRTAGERRVPVALRIPVAFAALGVGASVCGTATVALLLWLLGTPERVGGAAHILLRVGAAYVAAAVVIGSIWSTWLQRRTTAWLAEPYPPSVLQARRALRLPATMALVPATLWLAGTGVAAGVAATVAPGWDAVGITLAFALGGMGTTGVTYLLVERVTRPVLARALEVLPPSGSPKSTVLFRLVLVWAMASGLPLLDVLLVLTLPSATPGQRTRGALFLASAGIVVGALATGLLARAVALPLWRMRAAVGEIAQGHTEVTVQVDDSTEIGLLQSAVNDMVTGMRERARMQDLFGRHVGTEVAAHALAVGASLSGDVREMTALFVDVVDSTGMAARLPPQQVVAKLNRFFGAVVDATGAHGGLVNKFVGDAALCIFGAPVPLAQPETAALQAARRIRDVVSAAGELDLGIGIATGRAFAGQLGSRHRMEYTVIGDPVNEAARLTDHAKHVPGRILAAEPVIEAASDDERCRWLPHAQLPLRGRDRLTTAWTVV